MGEEERERGEERKRRREKGERGEMEVGLVKRVEAGTCIGL